MAASRDKDVQTPLRLKMIFLTFICLLLMITVILSTIYPTLLSTKDTSNDTTKTAPKPCSKCKQVVSSVNLTEVPQVRDALDLVTVYLRNLTRSQNIGCQVAWTFNLSGSEGDKFHCIEQKTTTTVSDGS